MNQKFRIREIASTEIHLLESFLYDAIFIPEGVERPDKTIIKIPELNTYIKSFGKDTDHCLVAETNGILIGAVWSRIFPESEKGFGYLDSETPELCMSVNEKFRKKGVGTSLFLAILEKLKTLKYQKVSLSVDKINYAFKLYQKFGFEVVRSNEESVTMVKKLKG
ncbi:GNAT family N-acetyltransferase [Marinilabilia sp.]|uniref:GNAT family N-acetyltransferase n=1 Tax=Marinilabilia sp. TaxID=2021252 RepID=UPI0025C23F78|nr:GNAT family N-acetyltransferase [Marinilabilia sp.]